MLTTLNRHIVLPLVAVRRGSRHLAYLRRLDESQFASPATIAARQLVALRAQLAHAYATVPYYRQAWAAAGVHPDDVRSLADLAHFPVLTKATIRAQGPALLSEAGDRRTWRRKTTSGSTGVPLAIYLDEPAAQWKTACTIRADQWSGYRLGQRVAKVWGNPEYRHDGLRGRLRNAVVDRATYLDTIGLNPNRIRAFADALVRRPPGLLFGHAHSLYLVACELKKLGITTVRPAGVVSTAMPLHAWQRPVIEAVFGVRATDRYGCEEVSLIACECDQGTGLHVAAESVLTEVPPGGGKLLVTDLVNRAMPLIRYQVGDVATEAAGVCGCGRGLPRLAKIEGRDADFVVTPAGDMISGISLTENFALHIPGVAQLQLVQETRTLLRLRLVPDAQFGPGQPRQNQHARGRPVRADDAARGRVGIRYRPGSKWEVSVLYFAGGGVSVPQVHSTQWVALRCVFERCHAPRFGRHGRQGLRPVHPRGHRVGVAADRHRLGTGRGR